MTDELTDAAEKVHSLTRELHRLSNEARAINAEVTVMTNDLEHAEYDLIAAAKEMTEKQAEPGREAEELRNGIEILIENTWTTNTEIETVFSDLQKLIDSVDARDSLGYLVAKEDESLP